MANIKVEGLSDLDYALQELPKATARNVLVRVLTKEAQPIAEAARSYAPVLTGRLAKSYTVSTRLSARQSSLNSKESDVEVYIGPGPLPEATQTEFGNAHQAAHPHLRPAWDQNVNLVLNNIAQDLAAEIEKSRQRLARKAEREAAKLNQS
jgi:HK97 gp10 family phage protein